MSKRVNKSTEKDMCYDFLTNNYREGAAQATYQELKATGDFIGFAQRYMHDADHRRARNALWTLTKATNAELAQLQPLQHELIELAMTTPNSSVRRLSLNIVERLKMGEEDLRTDFLDFCLEHMQDIQEYPGVQSLCMKLAYRMSAFYPELQEEMLRIVEGMEISYYKPAVKSVRNRILKGKL